jgi:hypothetical protein
MASNKEISISSDDLSKEGYSALAVKTPDNKLDASRLDTEAAREEVSKLAKALTDKSSTIQNVTAADLSALLEEAQNTAQQALAAADGGTIQSEIPAEIKSAADATRTKINTVFGDPKSMDFHHYLSVWRRIKSVIPGNEVSTIKDVEDVKNQSYEYINGLVDYLESESSNDKMEMNLSALPWGQAPGWYPTTDITKFSNPQDKQAKIKEIMEKINKSLEGESAWWNTANWMLAIGGFYFAPKMVWWATKFMIHKIPYFGPLLGAWADALHDSSNDGRWKLKKAVAWALPFGEKIPGLKRVKATLSHAAPTSGPWATQVGIPVRTPDLENNKFDKAVSNDILHEIYNAEQRTTWGVEIANNRPLPWDWNKPELLSISHASAYADYTSRMNWYLSLGDKPTDPVKLEKWQRWVGAWIRGETKAPWVFSSRTTKAAWYANEADRLATGKAAHKSAVSEAHIVSYSIGGSTFEVSWEAESKLKELQAQEQAHGKAEKELKELITEKTQLEWIKDKLVKRQKAELTIEQNTADINIIESKIVKIKDPATGTGTLKSASDDLKIKKQALASHRAKFTHTKWPLTGQPNDLAFQADSQTVTLTHDLEAAEAEMNTQKSNLSKLEKQLEVIESRQAEDIRTYRSQYGESPRASSITTEKLKWNGMPWSLTKHNDGILEKIATNEVAQKNTIQRMKTIWTDVKRLGMELESTPKMTGKLNGIKVSEISVKTKIAWIDNEIPSLKGMTEKLAKIAQEVTKKAASH